MVNNDGPTFTNKKGTWDLCTYDILRELKIELDDSCVMPIYIDLDDYEEKK